MKKILLLAVMAIGLVGCEGDTGSAYQGRLACINEHLYRDMGPHEGFVTIYDYRTDKPTLVQCRKTENGIEYEKEKIK